MSWPSVAASPAPRHPRFRVLGALGWGGRGTVFEAVDRLDGSRVALKALNDVRGTTGRELKADFRRLADVHHPNLVDYYELHTDGVVPFFSMQLIEGTDLEGWLRSRLRPGELLPEERHPQLEDVLLQLAAGVQALHDRGLLHRDIKPSNVLVEPDGRVVLLDFGLATAWPGSSGPRTLVGTPTYMAPERLGRGESSPASDWFAVGAVVGELLTGEKPGPVSPEGRRFNLPDSPVARLVADLMHPDPGQRAGVDAIERALGRRRPSALAPPAMTFVGRTAELDRLRQAWFRAQSDGRAVALSVRGPSGIGKSALLERFLSDLEGSGVRVEVLRGRCHPRETLPFGALDAWLDHLASDPQGVAEAASRVAADVDLGALAVLFPALAVALGRRETRTVVDRQRGEAARGLGRLLAAWAERRPLILACDDAQWMDPDSASVLREVVGELTERPVLMIWVERTELPERPSFRAARDLSSLPVEALRVAPLGREESLVLLKRHAPRFARHHESWADAARGSPLLLGLLAEADEDPGASDPWWRAVDARLSRLSEDARRLLEWACVHRGPLDPRLVSEADPTDLGRVVAALVKARWLRHDHRGEAQRVAPHHDLIRESVLAHMSPARLGRVHGLLADALIAHQGNVGAIAGHLVAAGRSSAGAWAARAGFEAASQQAYARARRWLQVALEHEQAIDREAVLAQLGECYRQLGEIQPASDAFLAAARLAEHRDGLDAVLYRCRASEILLAAGHLEDGRRVLEGLLDQVGLSLPSGGLLGALRAGLARARVRRLAIPEPRSTPLSGAERHRLEVAYTAVSALGLTDSIAAGVLQAEHLRLAAAGGDRRQLARALGVDLVYRASSGRENEDLARVRSALEAMLPDLDSPEVRAFARSTIGYAHFLRGEFLTARPLLAAGADAFARLKNASWASRFVDIHLAITDVYLGALEDAFAREARVRGAFVATKDHVASAYLALGTSYVRALANDRPEAAESSIDAALEPWPSPPPVLAYLAAVARLHVALYRGDVDAAESQLRAAPFDLMARAGFQHMRILEAWFQGWRALAKRRLGAATRRARGLRREGVPWARGLAATLEAGVASREGRLEPALARAREAEATFFEQGMRLHGRALSAWTAELTGSSPELALASVASLGIEAPRAMMRLYVPPALPAS